MQETLPPLLGREDKSLLGLRAGKEAMDLRPVKGATMLACAGARLTTADVDDSITDEAIATR